MKIIQSIKETFIKVNSTEKYFQMAEKVRKNIEAVESIRVHEETIWEELKAEYENYKTNAVEMRAIYSAYSKNHAEKEAKIIAQFSSIQKEVWRRLKIFENVSENIKSGYLEQKKCKDTFKSATFETDQKVLYSIEKSVNMIIETTSKAMQELQKMSFEEYLQKIEPYSKDFTIVEQEFAKVHETVSSLNDFLNTLLTKIAQRRKLVEEYRHLCMAIIDCEEKKVGPYYIIKNTMGDLCERDLAVAEDWRRLQDDWSRCVKYADNEERACYKEINQLALIQSENTGTSWIMFGVLTGAERSKGAVVMDNTLKSIEKGARFKEQTYSQLVKMHENLNLILQWVNDTRSACEVRAKNELKDFSKFFAIVPEYKKAYYSRKEVILYKNFYEQAYNIYHNPYVEVIPKRIHSTELFKTEKNFEKYVQKWNNDFIIKKSQELDSFFRNLNERYSDVSKRAELISVDDFLKVDADADKDNVIISKLKYLTDILGITADKILVFSHDNTDFSKLDDLLALELPDKKFMHETFSSFGEKIISQIVSGNDIEFFDNEENFKTAINKLFHNLTSENQNFAEKFAKFALIYQNLPKDVSYFENNKDEFFNVTEPTYAKHSVKNYAELIIANFLYLNGIDYEYNFTLDNSVVQNAFYQTDFYLKDYDVHLIHHCVNAKGKAVIIDSLDASKYEYETELKRKQYLDNNLKFIETYSYQLKDGVIYKILDDAFNKYNIAHKPINEEFLIDLIMGRQCADKVQNAVILFEEYLKLFKGNCCGTNDFKKAASLISTNNDFEKKYVEYFMDIFSDLFVVYQDMLNQNKQADIYDISRFAADMISKGTGEFNYEYIIVNDYQDIVKDQFDLLKSLIERHSCLKVFCVTNQNELPVKKNISSKQHLKNNDKNIILQSLIIETQKYLYAEEKKLIHGDNTKVNTTELAIVSGSNKKTKSMFSKRRRRKDNSVLAIETRS